jgi:DNA-binding XRE family transcriptional regulator
MVEILIETRAKYELSRYAVAKAAGMDRNNYKRLELGEYKPSEGVALNIVDAFTQLVGTKVITYKKDNSGFRQHQKRGKAAKTATRRAKAA